MAPEFDTALLRAWIDAATETLAAARDGLDRINVFPVADHDTGSNLLFTLRSAGAEPVHGAPAAAASIVAAAAVRGARGNSGLILSQLLRGVADELAAGDGAPVLGRMLRRGADLATAAVADPLPGTALSVLDAAADALGPAVAVATLADAAQLAARAGRDALAERPDRPVELVRAGVVDAGALGLVLVLDALVAASGGTPEPPPSDRVAPPTVLSARPGDTAGARVSQPVYEVTYRLPDPGGDALAQLRTRLIGLGDSVVVAGDGRGGHAVHVHTTEAGAAVEAGLAVGRPSAIRIEVLPPSSPFRARAVLLMIESSGAGALARAAGGDVLVADPDPGLDEVLAAIRATGAAHVVVLPCAAHRRALAETAAERARADGVDAVAVPTTSVLQGLAALAVHDPDRRASDDVVAMTEAAAGTRTGGLQIAETEALTWAGPCRPGEVLGLSDGEVVLIAPDLAVGALWLAHRMLSPGGELVTVLLGAAAGDALGERIAEDLRRTHPEVDVLVHRGDQSDYPLVLGVE